MSGSQAYQYPDKKVTIAGRIFDGYMYTADFVVFDLGGQYDLFECWIGLDEQWSTHKCRFRIELDGELAFESPSIQKEDKALQVKVSVKGKRSLKLSVTESGIWAEPKLICGSKQESKQNLKIPALTNPSDGAKFLALLSSRGRRWRGLVPTE